MKAKAVVKLSHVPGASYEREMPNPFKAISDTELSPGDRLYIFCDIMAYFNPPMYAEVISQDKALVTEFKIGSGFREPNLITNSVSAIANIQEIVRKHRTPEHTTAEVVFIKG